LEIDHTKFVNDQVNSLPPRATVIPDFYHERSKILAGICASQFLSIGLTSFYDDVVRMMGQMVQRACIKCGWSRRLPERSSVRTSLD
jgi:hypothetical protein